MAEIRVREPLATGWASRYALSAMLVICDQCPEWFDSNDVIIDHGEMACPACAAVIDLDDAIRASAEEPVPLLDEALPAPDWMIVQESDDELVMRWRMRQRADRDMWTITLIAVGLLAGFCWCMVGVLVTPTSLIDKLMPLLLVPLALLAGAISLGMWLSSTVIRMDRQSITVCEGPIPLKRRFLEIYTSEVRYFWCKPWSDDEDSVCALSCAISHAGLVTLVDNVPNRAGAFFVKQRLGRFLHSE